MPLWQGEGGWRHGMRFGNHGGIAGTAGEVAMRVGMVGTAAGEPRVAVGREVIGLGTVTGCSGAEVGRWFSPGDVVELSAGPLGRLRSTVGEPEPWRRPS